MKLGLKRPPRFAARRPRAAVDFCAELLLPDDRVIDVIVRNVSESGFMGACRTAVRAGTWLGVDLPGYGIARAVVRWSEDGEFGCQFRKPLPAGAAVLRL